jgi:hypothetical protein
VCLNCHTLVVETKRVTERCLLFATLSEFPGLRGWFSKDAGRFAGPSERASLKFKYIVYVKDSGCA